MPDPDPSRLDEGPNPPLDREDRWAGPPTRSNPMAVASLVCGLLFCVPVIMPTLAVVFGFLGVRRTRDPAVMGKGMSIAGLVLGLVGVGGQLILGLVLSLLYNMVSAELVHVNEVSNRFIREISEGKIDDAMKIAGPDVRRDEVEAASKAMKSWGPFNYLGSPLPQLAPIEPGQYRWIVEVAAVFSRKTQPVKLILIKDGKTYQVERFEMKIP